MGQSTRLGHQPWLLHLWIALGLTALVLVSPAWAQAGSKKVLNWHFEAPEIGFDPAATSDYYSSTVNEAIFERLLTYDYLARPLKLVPQTATQLPEISADKKTFTFKIQPGIYFADDPAFKGERRELTARDYVYSFLRHVDPKNRSPWASFFLGKVEGLDELVERAKKSGKFDYDAKIPGFETPDRHTLVIRLTRPDLNFPYVLAHGPNGAVAREVIEHYGAEIIAHPVGTGPYQLTEWVRRSKIVLKANPNYRTVTWNFTSDDPADQPLIKSMQGKRIPQIDTVVIHVVEEAQAIWLAFQQKQLDLLRAPAPLINSVLENNQLKPSLASQGVQLTRQLELEILYTFFNMKDPVVGGLSREKIALRRAIAMAYNNRDEIDVVRRGQAIRAHMVVPTNVRGFDPAYRSSIPYDPDLANRLLDRYGFKIGSDGWRTMPDGQPLKLRYSTEPNSTSRELNEIWRKSMQAIHVDIEFIAAPFSDNYKASALCKLAMWSSAWIADYPDAENFFQLLYSKNVGQTNHSCYESPRFDQLYETMISMDDGPERNAVVQKLNRVMEADTPWVLNTTRRRNWVNWNRVQGFKKHPIIHADWIYMDVEATP